MGPTLDDVKRVGMFVVALVFLAAACGGNTPIVAQPGQTIASSTPPSSGSETSVAPTTVTTASSATTETVPATQAPSACTRDDVAGCALLGLILDQPLPLADVIPMGPAFGGITYGLYATTASCVPVIEFSPTPSGAEEPSRFAYVDAPAIAQRRMDAVNAGLSPPITGLHISQSYWAHYDAEWEAARQPGVMFQAVLLYLPEARAEDAAGDLRVASTVLVPGRRTDSLDPGYPGELYIDDDTVLYDRLAPVPEIVCRGADTPG